MNLFAALRKTVDEFPCSAAVPAVLDGALAVLLFREPELSLLFLLPVPGLLAAWLVLGTDRAVKFFVPWLCAGLISCLLTLSPGDAVPGIGSGKALGAEAVFVLDDPSLAGGGPDWLPDRPKSIGAELVRFRWSPDDKWKTASAGVFLSLPKDFPACRFGDTVRVSGRFEPIASPAVPGAFDYANYAFVRGKNLRFLANGGVIASHGNSPMRMLCGLRGRFLKLFCSEMRDPASKRISAALFFGMRQTVTPDERDAFLKSGTLHVLSVSGLHIAMVCSVLVLLLRIVPSYRLRWLAVILPVYLYAASTGMASPALRSFLMFAAWCLLRVFLARAAALNSILLAAAVMLAWNPRQALDAGFQYSFLCVGFLMISGGFVSSVTRSFGAVGLYSFGKTPLLRRFGRILLPALAGSAVAWLASFEISLLHQGLYSPWAVPAYLLMSPALFLAFAVFVGAMLLSWIPGAAAFGGMLAEPFLVWIRGVTGIFSETGCSWTSAPPWWVVPLFLAALACVLLFRNRRAAGIVFLLLTAFAAFQLISPLFRSREAAVFASAGAEPSVVLCAPGCAFADVVNLGSFETAGAVRDYLHSRGIQRVAELHFDSARASNCRAGAYFLEIFPVDAVYFHSPVRWNAKAAADTLGAAANLGLDPGSGKPSALKVRKTASGVVLEHPSPLWKGVKIELASGAVRVHSGTKVETVDLPPSPDFRFRIVKIAP